MPPPPPPPPPPSTTSLLPLLLLLLATTAATASKILTHPTDLSALKSFHASILPSSIPPWSCLASWDFASSDPCATPRGSHFTCGVSCTPPSSFSDVTSASFHRITALTLDPAGYTSAHPLPKLPPTLQHLDLPPSLLPPGPFPSSLPSSLLTLSLPSNSLSGHLPSHLPPNLTSLDLSGNSLSGPLPSTLSSLSSLRILDLSFNRLTGPLPAHLPPNLVTLTLRANHLSGPLLRSTFSPLRHLKVSELATNSFSGAFPLWFLHLPSLQQVNLANNSLSFFHTSGRVGWSSVVAVELGFNRIAGRLPPELARFGSLAALSVRHNRLTGGIPWEYYGAKRGRPFRRLYLDGNYLNGKVPTGFISTASYLTGSFADNCLEGCSSKVALCGSAQKSADVCRSVYGRGTSRHPPPRSN